jgi:glycosyl transferase family 87
VSGAARRDPLVWACAAVGLYDVLQGVLLFTHGPVIGFAFDVLYPDFLVFHAAARAFLEGKLAVVYDLDAFTAYQNALYPDHFRATVEFRPFLYPPTWLLLVLPFGLLAASKAYALFAVLTAGLATIAQRGRLGWGWLAVLTSPAALWVVVAGQNTFLSLALFYGGLQLLPRAPWLGGALLGVLAYKPQIWVLVPLALVAAREWRAVAAMLGTAALLMLASAGIFGAQAWLAFAEAAREAATPQFADALFRHIHVHLTSLMGAARMLGLSAGTAGLIQLAGTALSAIAVWLAFRRPGDPEARIAVLATATFLVSPYTLNYDLLLLMPALVALYRQGLQRGFLPLERPVHIALWLAPSFGVLLNNHDIPLMPVIILLCGLIAWKRLLPPSKVELPAAAGAR